MIVVVDSSVAIKWFVPESGRDQACKILNFPYVRHAPDLLVAETLNVLRRKERLRQVDPAEVDTVAMALSGYFERLVPANELGSHALELSRALDHSVYDCVYLACAMALACPLVTADTVFRKKTFVSGFGQFVWELSSLPQPS